MKEFSSITDPQYIPPASFTRFERWCLKLMNDPRDLPFVRLLIFLQLTVIPFALFLFTPVLTSYWWWIAYLVYFFYSQIFVRGPFGLMYHAITHRRLFRKKYNLLNQYIVWFMGPFFGNTPETFFSHHIGMHHAENNMPDDASSTMYFQRDSIKEFGRYYINFIFLGFYQTFTYLFTRKKKKYYMRFTVGEWTFIAACVLLCFVNMKATLLVLVFPVLFSRCIMMLGNWTQHAFIDPSDPDNSFVNAIICVNTSYNRKCWNDGYHIVHHLKPGIHYTDMPGEYLKLKDELAHQKSFVFEQIHYLHIFFFLMTKQYRKLSRYMVNINGTFSSPDEAIQLMKQRTRRFQ